MERLPSTPTTAPQAETIDSDTPAAATGTVSFTTAAGVTAYANNLLIAAGRAADIKKQMREIIDITPGLLDALPDDARAVAEAVLVEASARPKDPPKGTTRKSRRAAILAQRKAEKVARKALAKK